VLLSTPPAGLTPLRVRLSRACCQRNSGPRDRLRMQGATCRTRSSCWTAPKRSRLSTPRVPSLCSHGCASHLQA